MDEQTRFRTALAALAACAEKKDGTLTREDVAGFLTDMELDEEQLGLIYAYLASKHIRVEGVEEVKLPGQEETPYTEEEQEFLKQYKKDSRQICRQPTEALEALFDRAAGGEKEARRLLTEHYMDRVLEIAQTYAHRGLLLQDLVQEGSLGLLIGLDTLGLMEEGLTGEAHLEREIRRAIREALDLHEGEKSTGEEITEKLNRLAESVTGLTEELGRQVSPEELSLYLDMSLEEIEDLLRIAGELIETADSHT
ncbi:MAG: sigma-70 domain-containing protein [Eubacteriales bacterium]|nr:sigma-70 domain-containing protein [Eubacteriales bacterium]